MPFLENVTRGRGRPPERLEEVAHHYERFGGVSPINAPEPRADRRARGRARRARHRPADLPRQPQLAPVPRGHAARDGRRRRPARARVLHVGVQLATRAAASTARTSTSAQPAVGPEAPEVAEAAHVLQPPGLRRGERRPRRATRSRRSRTSGATPRRRLHRAQHPARDGRAAAATQAQLAEKPPASSPPAPASPTTRSCTRAGAALRTSRGSGRTSATTCARCARRGVEDVVMVADRLRLRPRRGALRPRRRGKQRSAERSALNLVRAGDGGDASGVRRRWYGS